MYLSHPQELKLIAMRVLFTVCCIWALAAGAAGQTTPRPCGQPEALERFLGRNPFLRQAYLEADEALERETRAYSEAGDRDELIVIPVVFHIIHFNGPENISDEQVYSAVEVMNRDFRKLNTDITQVIPEFADIAADVEIEFRLAQRDPSGNCHTGINRILSELTYVGDDGVKDLIQWPRNKYLNIWVVEDAAGAAGYSLYPSSVNGSQGAGEDGIVVAHDYCGAIGTSNTYRSRTLTHEAGHWMNLRHTWGNSNEPGLADNCDEDDLVNDTPNTIGWLSCNLAGESCGGLNNVQNYMEYSYCSRMFTEGQRTRMRAAMNSTTAQRNQLWTASNLAATGATSAPILCEARFEADRRTVCVGDTVFFTDASYHGVTSWSWAFGDGATATGDEGIAHAYSEPGFYAVSLTVGNGVDEVSHTETDYIQVLEPDALPLPVVQGFEASPLADTWFIEDVTGDGATWEQVTSAAASGTRSLRIHNWSNATEFASDRLITSTMDVSGMDEVVVSYKWAFSFKGTNETDDRLKIYASGDCGKTWSLRRMHRGFTDLPSAEPHSFAFTPAGPEEWKSYTLDLPYPQFLTSGFRLMFEFESRLGNNIFLDDINIVASGPAGVGTVAGPAGEAPVLMPNPTRTSTVCAFTLAQPAAVRVEVSDASGRVVRGVEPGSLAAGMHRVQVTLEGLSPGVYFVRVVAAGVTGRPARLVVE